MLKNFSEWFGLKKKLRERQQTPPLVRAGHFVGGRWRKCRIEDQRQERAVLATGHHLQEALAWILFRYPDNDTKERGGWFLRVRYERTDMTACLHEARAIDDRRLSSWLGQLDGDDFENVHSGFRKLYK